VFETQVESKKSHSWLYPYRMNEPHFLPPERSRLNWPVIVLVAIIGIWLIGNIGGQDRVENSTNTNPSPVVSQTPYTDWIPAGYSSWDAEVAYTVADSDAISDAQCITGYCLAIMVVARDGCPSNLYAEIDLIDKSGIKIGYQNDSLGSLTPNTRGMLVFNLSEDEVLSISDWPVSKITCY